MAVAASGQLNLEEPPPIGGSRSVDCFEKLELIGKGTFGQVFMAREIDTEEIVALKKIRMDGQTQEQGFPITAIREIKILKRLHHENIIRLREVVTSSGREDSDEEKQEKPGLEGADEDKQEEPEGPDDAKQEKPDKNKYKGRGIYMVFEYMDYDLSGLFYSPEVTFTVPQIKCYMKQLLTGLRYCHQNQVLHRDIKGANLLINNEGTLKLADFGLARWFNNAVTNVTSKVVTLWYRPPELLLGAVRYGISVDIWSVGVLFAELLSGEAILQGKSEIDQLNKIYQLCGTPDEENWPGVSKLPLYEQLKPILPMDSCLRETFNHFDPLALDLLEKMLVLDPAKRISPANALADAYFSTEPLPCDPKSLPSYESSHDLKTQKKRKQLREEEKAAKEKSAAAKDDKSAAVKDDTSAAIDD